MYVKLHDSIFGSSIMEEDIEIRYIWMCMLTIADSEGFIDETIPALARRFNISETIMGKAIETFLSPDPTSRTPDNDGRRIEAIRETFGWHIINYKKYRDIRNTEERKEYMRKYMRKYREVKEGNCKQNSLHQSNGKQKLAKLAKAETETEAETDKQGNKIEASASPFQLPTDEDINECAIPKIKEYINQLADALYQESIFPEAPSFKNTMLKKKKNPRAILHVLIRCYLKKTFESPGPWAYCEKIMQVEDANFNEREYQKTAITDND